MKATVPRNFLRTLAASLIIGIILMAAACTPRSSPTATTTTPQKAVKLVFTTQPLGSEAGAHLVVQPVVSAVDAGGKVVSGSRLIVTLTLTDVTPEMHIGLYGATTLTSLNGIFSFKELSIDKVGTYTLTAACNGLASAVSNSVEITPIGGARLKFTSSLTNSVGGETLKAQAVVTVMDMYGNISTGSNADIFVGMISVTPDPYGAKLFGTLNAKAVNGVATFKDLSIDLVGTYVLTAFSPGLVPTTSNTFEIIPGEPVKLFFNSQPITTTPGSPLTTMPPTIPVLVQDKCGNTVVDSSAEVTIFITPNTGTPGAVLSGPLKVKATTGSACFGDLSIDKVGKGYTLTATSPGLVTAVSDPFDIVTETATTTNKG